MKKYLILLLLLISSTLACYCNNSDSEIKADKIKQEKMNEKQEESMTGAAKPVENFEYKPCKGDEKTKACKIEDLIKKDDKNKEELP